MLTFESVFRNSKLTQLLADSLSGQAKVMMFLHIAPETTSHSESVSTLKFGSRVSEITLGQAAKNVERGSPLEVREAQVLTHNSRHASTKFFACIRMRGMYASPHVEVSRCWLIDLLGVRPFPTFSVLVVNLHSARSSREPATVCLLRFVGGSRHTMS